ncbi:hypothetical protein FQ330_02470 [Agrococcus sediminis]|uniref:Uncharacterized protein n=1 Tax=Agrococcus sediminis TaxID=2599924 RepID=A0A5M8QMU5_9MICO|nr:hypothetical protein [Agrococcus sediminis]KAA6436294.1 hypothetical protein FQ330_02470 [Agrococcus sediminis]
MNPIALAASMPRPRDTSAASLSAPRKTNSQPLSRWRCTSVCTMVALYSFERLSKPSVTMTTCTVASLASSGKRLDALAEAVEVGADGVVERSAAAGTSSIATSSSAALRVCAIRSWKVTTSTVSSPGWAACSFEQVLQCADYFVADAVHRPRAAGQMCRAVWSASAFSVSSRSRVPTVSADAARAGLAACVGLRRWEESVL